EVDLEVAVEECWIGRRGQGRGAVHRGFDRFTHRLIPVAFANTYLRHFPSRDLGHVQHALYPRPRRRRSQPRARDPGGDLRLPARQRRARACHLGTLLGRETALQFRHAVTALLSVRLFLTLRRGTLLRRGALFDLTLLLGLALLGLTLLLGLLRLRGLQLRRLLLGGAALFGRRRFRLLPLLLAVRPFLGRRWRWSDRLLRLLGRRRGGGRCGLRRRLHRAFHGARLDHGGLDRQRRRRPRRLAEHQPSVHQRGQQRSVQQHRQHNRNPSITLSLHCLRRISSRAGHVPAAAR